MPSATEKDLREIRAAIEAIARATEANSREIANLAQEMRTGFSDADTKIANLAQEMRTGFSHADTQFADLKEDIKELKADIKALDNRLWTFGGTILIAVLGALLTIFGRFLFSGNP